MRYGALKKRRRAPLTLRMDKSNHIGDTVRIQRPPRVVTDALGHNIWATGFEERDFELEPPEVATDPYNTLTFDD